MASFDRDKYATVGFVKRAGGYRVRRVRGDRGRTRGFQVEDREGRVAAVVRPDTVRAKITDGKAVAR